MTGLQRACAAVRFEPTDRLPVIPQVFAHAGRLCGVSVNDYVRDGEVLARCQLAALAHYDYDAVHACMGVAVEAEGLGSPLRYRPDLYPAVTQPLLDDPRSALPELPDPREAGRMPELLRALELLRRDAAGRVLVVGFVLGPMTLACQLLGVEQALLTSVDDPEGFARLLDFATQVGLVFGTAQIEAGAHVPLVFDPSASPEVVPPGFFQRELAPRLGYLGRTLRERGALAFWMHTAGQTRSILPLYARMGVDLANFDYCVSPEDACRALPHTSLNGNVMPLAFVDHSPEEIRTTALALRHHFASRGGFILSSGCEIPPESVPDNVAALVAATR